MWLYATFYFRQIGFKKLIVVENHCSNSILYIKQWRAAASHFSYSSNRRTQLLFRHEEELNRSDVVWLFYVHQQPVGHRYEWFLNRLFSRVKLLNTQHVIVWWAKGDTQVHVHYWYIKEFCHFSVNLKVFKNLVQFNILHGACLKGHIHLVFYTALHCLHDQFLQEAIWNGWKGTFIG